MTELLAYPTIIGVGEGLPPLAISNAELIEQTGIDSDPMWIENHTGIRNRYWVEHGQTPSDLAVIAARQALHACGADPQNLSGIYLATTTPDHPSPSTASIVHGRIGAPEECLAVDLKAACAGGIMGIEAASNRLRIENDNSIALVIGANTLSRTVNKQDRRTVILFGDGAGAAVLQQQPGANKPESVMFTQPNQDALLVPAGGMVEVVKSPNDPRRTIHMDGPTVKKHAIDIMTRASERVAQKAGIYDPTHGIDWSQIDFLIPHQANARLIEAVGENLQVPTEKCIITVADHGNTSSASGLLALSEARKRGEITAGRKRVLFTAVGAGFVGGSVLIDVNLP